MRTVLAIARRELAAAFVLPIAWVFLASFLALSGFLGLLGFFERNVSDLRDYFVALKWAFLLFVPAVSMRLWAEERRAGTFELLFSLPVRPWQAVVGKFIGAFALIALTLVLGAVLPLSLSPWASFDAGQIAAGYLGALLLATLDLALGLVISSLTENQIVAFVGAALASFALLVVGEPGVLRQAEQLGTPGWLVHVLATVGIGDHHEALSRGVLDTRDVVYFLAGAGALLVVNVLAVERRKPGVRLEPLVAAVLALAAFYVAADLATRRRARVDLTSRGAFTLAPATRDALAAIQDRLTVRAYLSASLPASVERSRRVLVDFLNELEAAGGGKVKLEVVDPRGDEALMERAERDGIQKFVAQIPSTGGEELTTRLIYAGVAFLYEGKPPLAIPVALGKKNLEYDVLKLLRRLVPREARRVALLTPLREAPLLKAELGATYTVEELDVTATGEIPKDYVVAVLDTTGGVAVAGSTTLAACEKHLQRGGGLVVLTEPCEVTTAKWQARPREPNALDAFLARQGVALEPGLVLERTELVWPIGMGNTAVQSRYPWFLSPTASSCPESPVLSALPGCLFFPFAGEVRLVPEKIPPGARGVDLVRTVGAAWRAEGSIDIHPLHAAPVNGEARPRAIGVGVEGVFQGGTAPGRLAVFADADFIHDRFVATSQDGANLVLALNVIDWAAGHALSLAGIRGRDAAPALLAPGPHGARREAIVWAVNVGGLPALLALAGLVRSSLRRRRGEAAAARARARSQESPS